MYYCPISTHNITQIIIFKPGLTVARWRTIMLLVIIITQILIPIIHIRCVGLCCHILLPGLDSLEIFCPSSFYQDQELYPLSTDFLWFWLILMFPIFSSSFLNKLSGFLIHSLMVKHTLFSIFHCTFTFLFGWFIHFSRFAKHHLLSWLLS